MDARALNQYIPELGGSLEKTPSRDDSDTMSENSDIGLISDDVQERHKPERLKWPHRHLVIEGSLVVVVVILASLLLVQSLRSHTAAPHPLSFGPRLREKVVTFGDKAGFGPDLVYSDTEMLRNETRMREVYENWQLLYSRGRGYVIVDEQNDEYTVNHPAFEIDPDGKVGTTDGQGYGWIMSVFHQLHCLSIITTRLGIPFSEFAKWDEEHLIHVSHCVEYLRQSILCSADTSLEGETGIVSDSVGWNQKHICTDFDALQKWSNDHTAWDLTEQHVVDLTMHPGPRPNQTGG